MLISTKTRQKLFPEDSWKDMRKKWQNRNYKYMIYIFFVSNKYKYIWCKINNFFLPKYFWDSAVYQKGLVLKKCNKKTIK